MEPERLPRRGILRAIGSRADAINVVNDASAIFMAIVALLVGQWAFAGARTLLDLVLFGVIGALLWHYRSPAAAFALLLVSVIRTFVAIAQSLDTGSAAVLDLAVSAAAIFASIRAVEATLKLIGRFSGGGSSGT